MSFIINFYKSSIGKKWIVALTGLVLIGYVFGHLAGNLQIFLAPKYINQYATFLHSLGPALYVIRSFLLVCFFAHILTTILLAKQNRDARPQQYAIKASRQSSFATRTMVFGGLFVLCFVIFHLLQFTMRLTPDIKAIEHPPFMSGEYDCYNMVILSFQKPLISIFYIIGLFALCLHLSHGFQSLVQTLGLTSRKWVCVLEIGSRALAWVIFVGYISIPVSVMLHILNPVLK
ncbi:MAG: succinate dehydrogenase cytochrome b subunit [Verrucomicrobiota bacterium]